MEIEDLEKDSELTAEQLDDKYNPDGDGEHPLLTRDRWRWAVSNDETLQGYWLWVESELQSNLEEWQATLEQEDEDRAPF